MINTNIFINDTFRTLSALYDLKDDKNLVRVTQQELADILQISRPTVNIIFTKLLNEGYLFQDKDRVAHYYLTPDAIKVVKLFRKLEQQSHKKE